MKRNFSFPVCFHFRTNRQKVKVIVIFSTGINIYTFFIDIFPFFDFQILPAKEKSNCRINWHTTCDITIQEKYQKLYPSGGVKICAG